MALATFNAAGAEALDGEQGIAVVGGGLPIADGQLFFNRGRDLVIAHDPAADAVADQDDIPPHRPAEDQVVIGRYTVYGSR